MQLLHHGRGNKLERFRNRVGFPFISPFCSVVRHSLCLRENVTLTKIQVESFFIKIFSKSNIITAFCYVDWHYCYFEEHSSKHHRSIALNQTMIFLNFSHGDVFVTVTF